MVKIIALISMLLDHFGRVYFPDIIFFTVVGRFAFPLFAWSIAKGFKRTSNYKLYALRLALLAILSQIPYSLLLKNNYLNVCFTLLAGLLALIVYESEISRLKKCSIIVILLILAHVLNFEFME